MPVATEVGLPWSYRRRRTLRFFGKSGKTRSMKSRLPILVAMATAALPATMLIVRAQPPAEIDAAAHSLPQPAPNQLLAEAIAALRERRSVVAKVRHHAEIYGRDVIGS